MAADLTFNAALDISGADKSLHDFAGKVDDTSAKMERGGQAGGGLLSSITGLINPVTLVAGGAVALGAGLLGAAKAAGEEQTEIAQLTNTIKNSVPAWDGNTAAIDAAVAAGERKAFADSDLRASMGRLVTDTGSVEEAIRLQSIAMDLAASKGIPLAQATALVGKADDGSYAALSKLGIEIGKEATREEALAAIHAKTAGAADIFANSAEGAGVRIQATLGNAVEDIGSAVLPAFAAAASGVADFLMSDGFQGAISFVANLIGVTLGNAITFLQGLFGPLLTAAQPLADAFTNLGTGASTTTGPLQGLGAIFTTLQGAAQATISTFLEIGQNVFGAVSAAVTESILPALMNLGSYLGEALPPIIAGLSDFWTGVLLPAIQQVWGFITGTVIPVAGELVGWLINQIPGALAFLGDAWTNVLMPQIMRVWDAIQVNVLPLFADLADWLQANLPAALQTAADFWTNTLQPALAQVWEFVSTNVLPLLGDVAVFLIEQIPAAVQLASDAWNNVLQPALANIWQFLQVNVLPILQNVALWVGTNLPPLIAGLAELWNTTLLPALTAVWEFVNTNVLPLFAAVGNVLDAVVGKAATALAGIWQNVLQPALSAVWGFIDANLLPIFNTLVNDGINFALDAARAFASFWDSTLAPAIDGVASAIQTVIGWLNDLAAKIGSIELPDWMTPGSPTPWETGLRGVADAMQQLSGSEVPALGRAMARLDGTAGIGVGLAGVAPVGVGPAGKGGAFAPTIAVYLDGALIQPRATRAILEAAGVQKRMMSG